MKQKMEWLMWVAVGVIAYYAIVRFTAPEKGVKTLSTEELKDLLGKKDKQYVDVRTPVEFQANHIKGFQNIPLNELQKRSSRLAKEKETFVICQSGMRSNRASQLLKKQGFANIVNIKGGMNNYRK